MDEAKQQIKERLMSNNTSGSVDPVEKYLSSLETRLASNEGKVSELFAGQAKLESNDLAILTRLDFFGEQFSEIAHIIRTPKQFNFVGWITTALLILSLVGGIGMVVLKPIIDDSNSFKEFISKDTDRRIEEAFNAGERHAKIEYLIETQKEQKQEEERYKITVREELAETRISLNEKFAELRAQIIAMQSNGNK